MAATSPIFKASGRGTAIAGAERKYLLLFVATVFHFAQIPVHNNHFGKGLLATEAAWARNKEINVGCFRP